MALDPKSVVRIVTGLQNDPEIIPVGVIVHVSGSPGATSLFGWFNGPSGGVESHFHVDVLGRREQYRDTTREADANYRGNSWVGADGRRYGYLSVETQGGATGRWNPEQLASLLDLFEWLCAVHPTIKRMVATDVRSGGFGWHVMFGAGKGTDSWSNAAGKVCPGGERIQQCKDVLFPWVRGVPAPAIGVQPAAPAGPRLLGRGANGPDVGAIQRRLLELGYDLSQYGADEDFGEETEAAVKDLQRTAGLDDDGVVGPLTLAALDRGVRNTPDRSQLAVDGGLGRFTISLWQQVMGTPVDGVISPVSDLVKAVQRHLNAHIGAGLTVDGKGIRQDGREYRTVHALQRYLGFSRTDGKLDPGDSETVRRLQERLNTGRF